MPNEPKSKPSTRPPSEWWNSCVRKVKSSGSADDPEKVCGALWANKMSVAAKKKTRRAEGKVCGRPKAEKAADVAGTLLLASASLRSVDEPLSKAKDDPKLTEEEAVRLLVVHVVDDLLMTARSWRPGSGGGSLLPCVSGDRDMLSPSDPDHDAVRDEAVRRAYLSTIRSTSYDANLLRAIRALGEDGFTAEWIRSLWDQFVEEAADPGNGMSGGDPSQGYSTAMKGEEFRAANLLREMAERIRRGN